MDTVMVLVMVMEGAEEDAGDSRRDLTTWG